MVVAPNEIYHTLIRRLNIKMEKIMDFDPKDPRFNHCLKKEIEHYKKYLKEKEKKT